MKKVTLFIMQTIKSIIIILVTILSVSISIFADEEQVEVKLHRSVSAGNIRRSTLICNVQCLYDVADNSITISGGNGDFLGTRITIMDLATNFVEYSYESTSCFLYETFSLPSKGNFYIEIALPYGIVYYGNISVL